MRKLLRGLATMIVLLIICVCAWVLPADYCGWVTGLVGYIVVDIYGILIEKGKL